MSKPFKVAAVQAAPSFLDIKAGVRRAVSYIEAAAAADAKLVVFPETWLPGYPNHIWLGPVAWGDAVRWPLFRELGRSRVGP